MPVLDSMGGGAWPILVDGASCLVNSLRSSLNLLISLMLLPKANVGSQVARGTLPVYHKEVCGDSRSVMPLDVFFLHTAET